MNLLLDTHTLLWAMTKPKALPRSAHRLLDDRRNRLHFSTVNIFEVAAKRATGRRSAPQISAELVYRLALAADVIEVTLMASHAIAVETLAITHPDPFDRLLLAQAQVEGLQLVTHDERLAGFDSRTILF